MFTLQKRWKQIELSRGQADADVIILEPPGGSPKSTHCSQSISNRFACHPALCRKHFRGPTLEPHRESLNAESPADASHNGET